MQTTCRWLLLRKVDGATGAGLAGAVFRLEAPDGTARVGVSEDNGRVRFQVAPCSCYALTEVSPPDGYAPDPTLFRVCVDLCGHLFVDGRYTERFVIPNVGDMPILFPYTVNYYSTGISPENFLGAVTGAGALGDVIEADLTLFASAGYQTPGARSGAAYVTDVPEDNVVNVVYARQLLGWAVEFYANSLTPADFLGRVVMPPVYYGTAASLTPAQLDLYRPPYFQSGVQVGGMTTITQDGQVIRVLYLPLETRTVIASHFVEEAYGSGSFILFQTTQAYAFDGDVIYGYSLIANLGPNYEFSFSIPTALTVGSEDNVISLFYNRINA